ncbi:glycosyltransferase [Nocardioides sp. AE5]|uniref:glycosyltransferase n=1 Tax=Nocardioides sp. AE5 TaxID=2962573 RepID=UPI002880F914|nr:glycosyltransferase [Nocardioides sp. AE5]MDT0203980.1 glycosyltransferase [Nocardioides sp. AE5]
MGDTAPAAEPPELRRAAARDHAARVSLTGGALVRTALRTRSIHAREILAELAWPGHWPEDLCAWADTPGDVRVEAGMDVRRLVWFARVLALQEGRPDDLRRGAVLLERALAAGDLAEQEPIASDLLLQLRIMARDPRAADLVEAAAVTDEVRAAARADLANPHLFGAGPPEAWLARVNEVLGFGGPGNADLAPLVLRDGAPGDAPLDLLCAPSVSPAPGPQPLITVIMSCFRPGKPLLTAVRSIIEQSWQEWELLVVDDASEPEHEDYLSAVARMDPRVRVIRKAINGGTYRARNTALRQAAGELCTFLDSDDYLHPQALERSARALLDDDARVAVSSLGSRVSPLLEFNRPGYRPVDGVATSLMFRRAPVVSRIGFFDPTRKGADTEFANRIEAAFATRVHVLPLVLTLARSGLTLSSAEFSYGWRHPSRRAYRGAYVGWHKQIAAGKASPFLDPTLPRRFPEPRRWRKDLLGDGHRARFDLCLAGDWRAYGGPQRSMIEEIRAARQAGMRVAIMHLEAFRFMTIYDKGLCAPIMDLVRDGSVEWIQPDDDVEIDMLLVRYPPVLQYPPAVGTTASVRSLCIVANQAPAEPDGSDRRYSVRDVSDRAEEMFGVPATWIPQGPTVRAAVLREAPGTRVTGWDNPGLIDVADWQRKPGKRFTGGVRVGRYSRDNRIKFPTTYAELLRGYAFGDGYRVRMMGATKTVAALAEDDPSGAPGIPDNWELFAQEAMRPQRFLADLDFFLYLDNPDAHEAFGRVLLEAAASGVLTIAHPKHRETFGDLFDYALPGEAQELIARYVSDEDAYHARVARTLAMVQERYGHASFVERLRSLRTPEPCAAGAPRDLADPGGAMHDVPPLAVQLRRAPHRGAPLQVEANQPWQVRSVPLRAAADGERADQVTVLFSPGGAEDVGAWLRGHEALLEDERVDQALVDTVPECVTAVLVCRDGLAWACSRTQLAGLPDTAGIAHLAMIQAPPQWHTRAWWVRAHQESGTLLPQ